MPTSGSDNIAEVIRLLKEGESKRAEAEKKAVTQADLANVTNTVMSGISEVDTRLSSRLDGVDSRFDGVEGTLVTHALAIRALGGNNPPNVSFRSASTAPRRMSPMPQTISVEQTAGGGIRIQDGAQFDKLVKRLDEQEKTMEDQDKVIAMLQASHDASQEEKRQALDEKRIAQERQGAVQEYANKLEAKSKKNMRLFKRLAGVAAVPVIGAIVHLISAYVSETPKTPREAPMHETTPQR